MIARFLRLIRFSHTVFALPFALGSMLVAARGLPTLQLCGLILVCMVCARTAAMLFNRLADWEIDKLNPRTEGRHRLVPRRVVIAALVASSAAFVAATWFINSLCFWLSPVALVIIFFYSLTKRFTAYSHFFLGLALSVAPVGAWLAVRGHFDFAPLVLALAVFLWVAGFDLIYATQDYEFDRRTGLHSIIVKLGVRRSLNLARTLHWVMLAVLALFAVVAGLGALFFGSLVLVAGAVLFEHHSAAMRGLPAINQAFFWSNAFVGAVFVAGVAADIWWHR